MKKQAKKTKNYSASEFFRICDDAITLENTTKKRKLENRYKGIGQHYQKLLNKGLRDIVVAFFYAAVIISAPQLFNAGRNIFSWLPQVKVFDDLMPHIPILSLIICGFSFWSSLLFIFRVTKAGKESRNHLLRCIHKEDKKHVEWLNKREEKNEKSHTEFFTFASGLLTTAVTAAIVIIGMSIKADPLWAAAPLITFTGTSIGSIVIIRNKTKANQIDKINGFVDEQKKQEGEIRKN